MKKINEMSNEELTQFEVECKEAQKAIFTDIAKYENNSPEHNLLKTDFEKFAKLLVEIEKEKKSRKATKDAPKKDAAEIRYDEYKKTHDELVEELSETKKISIPKTFLILGAEFFLSKLFWIKAPTIFALLVTGASIAHIYNRIKKRVEYEKIKSNIRYLKKEMYKHENKGKTKPNIYTKTKGFLKSLVPTRIKNLFNFKNKVKEEVEDIKSEKPTNSDTLNNTKENVAKENVAKENDVIENELPITKENTSKMNIGIENKEEKENKTNEEKINELKKAKEEIIDGVYGLNKNQIIQDKVNIREICNFYGTNNTNPSSLKVAKEKVIVKNKAA